MPAINDDATERLILGKMMLGKRYLTVGLSRVKAEYFFNRNNQELFKTISEMDATPKLDTIDPGTIGIFLKNSDSDKYVEMTQYSVELQTDANGAGNNMEYLCEKLRENWMLRQFLQEISTFHSNVKDGDADMISEVDSHVSRLFDIKNELSDQRIFAAEEITKYYDKIIDGIGEEPVGTGFGLLDATLGGGLFPGRVYILGAGTGIGKTNFMLNILHNTSIINKHRAVYFSLEMPERDLNYRLISSMTGIQTTDLMLPSPEDTAEKRFTGAELDRIKEVFSHIEKASYWICDRIYRMVDVAVKVRELKRYQGVELVFIDYLQKIMPNDLKKYSVKANQYERMTIISQALQELAIVENVIIIAASQFSREGQKSKTRPTKYDLRDSGAIEQDADVVMILDRPIARDPKLDIYLDNKRCVISEEKAIERARLYIDKNRHGETGVVSFALHKRTGKFLVLMEDHLGGDG